MGFAERILDHAELARRGREAFDGRDLIAVGLDREHQAGAHRLAIDQHGAGTADAVLAAGMGAVEQKILTQRIEQRLARLHLGGADGAIDAQVNFHRAPLADFSAASARACSRARRHNVTATRRR